MSYRFRVDDTISKNAARVFADQIARAGRELALAGAIGVHEGRKSLKRIRSLLRLVRPVIGEKAFKAHNSAIRDIAAALSGTRDRVILHEALAKLEGRYGSAACDVFKPLNLAQAGEIEPDAAVLSRVRADLEREGARLAKLKIKGRGFACAALGLEECYRQGRRTLKRAYKNPSDEAFHDLRKTVQWHWRQMTLLSRAWPRYFDVRIEATRELSQILGDDHDLSVLLAHAQHHAAECDLDMEAIEEIIRQRQDELRREAAPRARRLFGEKPEAFAARIERYWQQGKFVKSRETVGQIEVHEPECAVVNGRSAAPRLPAKSGGDVPSQRRG